MKFHQICTFSIKFDLKLKMFTLAFPQLAAMWIGAFPSSSLSFASASPFIQKSKTLKKDDKLHDFDWFWMLTISFSLQNFHWML